MTDIKFNTKGNQILISIGNKQQLQLDQLEVKHNWLGHRYVTDKTGSQEYAKINDLIAGLEDSLDTLSGEQAQKILTKIKSLADESETQGHGIHKILSVMGNWVFGRAERLNKLTATIEARSKFELASQEVNTRYEAAKNARSEAGKLATSTHLENATIASIGSKIGDRFEAIDVKFDAVETALNEILKLQKKDKTEDLNSAFKQLEEQVQAANGHLVEIEKLIAQENAITLAIKTENAAQIAMNNWNPKTKKHENDLQEAKQALANIKELQQKFPDLPEIKASVDRAEKAIKEATEFTNLCKENYDRLKTIREPQEGRNSVVITIKTPNRDTGIKYNENEGTFTLERTDEGRLGEKEFSTLKTVLGKVIEQLGAEKKLIVK